MNALIFVNSTDQDQGLGVAFEAAIVEKKWRILDNYPSVYSKIFESADKNEIIKKVKEDMDYAVTEAEWEKVKYILTISDFNHLELISL